MSNLQQYLNSHEERTVKPDVSEPFINVKSDKSNMLELNECDDDSNKIADDGDE